MLNKVKARRAKGDKAYRLGIETVGKLLNLDPSNKTLDSAYKDLLGKRKVFEAARLSVENYGQDGSDKIPSARWLKVSTGHIYAQTKVRQNGISTKNGT